MVLHGFILNRWTIVLIYLFQSYVKLFSHTIKAGQPGVLFFFSRIFTFFVDVLQNSYVACKYCSELLDPSFLFTSDNAEKYAAQPMRFNMLLKMTKVKVKF